MTTRCLPKSSAKFPVLLALILVLVASAGRVGAAVRVALLDFTADDNSWPS